MVVEHGPQPESCIFYGAVAMGQTLEADAYSRCHTLEKIIKIHTGLDYDSVSGQAHRAYTKAKGMFDEVVALAMDQVAEGKVEV
jgi:hypothetical protein